VQHLQRRPHAADHAAGGDAAAWSFLRQLDGSAGDDEVRFVGEGALPSAYAVTDLAAASVAAAALAAARLADPSGATSRSGPVVVDRRLASLWFTASARPLGWAPPSPWDDLAGDYRCADGWVRLHTNASRHRAAALAALGAAPAREDVAREVERWRGDELEAAVVEAGGCAAAMRSAGAWAEHPQGRAVAAEHVVDRTTHESERPRAHPRDADRTRPMSGVRVLDLTRVLAGPVATRFLAGLGADVLRIDPPGWDEPGVLTETTLGKRCAHLDLRATDDLATLRRLLRQADVLVHGYRPGALERLGLGDEERRALAPGLVDVRLDAYGWTGPWAGRRGFDSLVQMSAGIADTGRVQRGADRPVPLPVQALDHATGHLLAAAAIDGWARRLRTGEGTSARTSLARVAAVLTAGPGGSFDDAVAPAGPADESDRTEASTWGPLRRLAPPCAIPDVELRHDLPAGHLGREPHPLRWYDDRS